MSFQKEKSLPFNNAKRCKRSFFQHFLFAYGSHEKEEDLFPLQRKTKLGTRGSRPQEDGLSCPLCDSAVAPGECLVHVGVHRPIPSTGAMCAVFTDPRAPSRDRSTLVWYQHWSLRCDALGAHNAFLCRTLRFARTSPTEFPGNSLKNHPTEPTVPDSALVAS